MVETEVAIPDFDRIISLMGSALCYAISIVLPLLFHVRLLDETLSPAQKVLDYTLIVIGCVFSVLGTVTALMR